ncbi:hypothetical protein GCM10009559_64040 [Pseudonocardia zijingensis]|uniref:Uncharacterized protein n=1 Tax=Pseudonocardia zijingensis TaxID=153376 RepID=A0ABN2ZE00_9PSEU
MRTLRQVLDRLDRTPEPERLADAAEIVRADLTASLDAFLLTPPAARSDATAGELGTQLEMIRVRTDRLASAGT